MRKIECARLARQFKSLVRKVNQMVESGSWSALAPAQRNKITSRLRRLFAQLNRFFSGASLRGALGVAGVVLGLSGSVSGQSFAARVANPFSLTTIQSGYCTPELADIDNDGDLDYFAGTYGSTVQYFQNTGTATAPGFGTVQSNPFGFVATGSQYYTSPATGDLDGDGDLDILVGGYYGTFAYYQNTGSSTVPAFGTAVSNPFGLSVASGLGWLRPEFVDIDADGDLDLMVGEYNGDILAYPNTGTSTAPAFGTPTTISGPSTYQVVPSFTDLDQDGDFDMMLSDYTGDFYYLENTGTPTSPAWATPVLNPFGLTNNFTSYTTLDFADIDGDGDEDLFVGADDGGWNYYENTSCLNTRDTLNPMACGSYTTPSGTMLTMSGTYRDTISNAGGCDSLLLINLTVNTSSSSSISPISCGPYVSPAGMTYTSSAMFSDTIPNAGGCDSVIAVSLTIPVVDTAVTMSGMTLSAVASGAMYQWYNCDSGMAVSGATAQSFTPSVTGNYAVIVTVNTCPDTSACFPVTIVGREQALGTAVMLAPNPAGDELRVSLDALLPDLKLEVFDLRGKVLARFTPGAARMHRLPVEMLPAGTYLLRVSSGGRVKTLRFVKS